MKTIAINERTGRRETVTVDVYGRVPRGYRTLTSGERRIGRVASLRDDVARYEARGDVVLAEQSRRTLADMGEHDLCPLAHTA